MNVCFFGTYDRGHSANRLLAHAVEASGARLDAVHVPLWEAEPNKTSRYFGARSLGGLARRYAAAAGALRRRWRARSGPPPVVLVGFGGQLDVVLAARVCRPRRGLVFAPLVSLTETLVEDRRVFPAGGIRARTLAALDRVTLRLPDLVLSDTTAHGRYLAALGARPDRVATWYLGAEPEFLRPEPPRPVDGRVLFIGRYLPLHGLETIVAAAARLSSRARITMVGDGPERERTEQLARELRAPIDWRPPLPLDALPAELAQAAVVLGVFGSSEKAAMVVPNKVYQAAAVGRPLVTRDGPGLREAFEPGTHCIACAPGDPDALAGAIARLLDDRTLAERIGAAARERVLTAFGPDAQAARIRDVLGGRFDGTGDG